MNKYKSLIATADNLITDGAEFMEHNRVLIIRGIVPNGEAKNKLWDIYSQIDPNFISGEILLEVDVLSDVKGCKKARLVTDESVLNVHKGPGVELPTIGTVRKGDEVMVISRTNVYWWLIRIGDIEGYCYAENIELV